MGENNCQLNGLRERTIELEAKMREKQQMRRKLMQQLEQIMAQLNVNILSFLFFLNLDTNNWTSCRPSLQHTTLNDTRPLFKTIEWH